MTLIGSRWGDRMESFSTGHSEKIPSSFFQTLRLPYRDWTTSEVNLTPGEWDLLRPDAALIRWYRSPKGEMAQVTIIAGHQKRSIHTPAYCMPGGGWEIIHQEKRVIPLHHRNIQAMRYLMQNDKGDGLLLTYFFTDGAYATSNLIQFQSEQLIKRIRGEFPFGALVRIIIPIRKDSLASQTLSDNFTQAMIPPILQRLSQAGAHSASSSVF